MSPTSEAWTFDSLAGRLTGAVVTPPDDGYEEARKIWNGRFDVRPSAVARCATPEDVEACLDFAREEGLSVSVRSGGHDYAGNSVCDDCLVVDVSAMDRVEVDGDGGTVRVGPGARWRDVDGRTQARGLATTGATVSTVGVAGYTLGGGTGHLARSLGLAADNLVAAEVVTPDRGPVRVSEREHPDLFWAIRGGDGNFGVVTELELRLHPVGPELLAGQLVFPYEDAPAVLRGYRELMAEAPDEFNCYAFFLRVPPAPAFPEEYHGRPALDLVLAHAGDITRGRELADSLGALGSPILRAVEPQPYVQLQQAFDAGVPEGLRWFTRAHYRREISDRVLDLLVEGCRELPGTVSMVYLEPMGGAIGRVEPTATAFPHRDAHYSVHLLPGWEDPAEDEAIMNWARGLHDDLTGEGASGVYVNLLAEDEKDRVPGAYGRNLERLKKVKARWDGDNLLRVNHNVEPAG